jgi:hypothetical protein
MTILSFHICAGNTFSSVKQIEKRLGYVFWNEDYNEWCVEYLTKPHYQIKGAESDVFRAI